MEKRNCETKPLQLNTDRSRFSRIGFSYFAFVVITAVLQLLISALVTRLRPEWIDSQWYTIVFSTLPTYFAAAPICVLLLRRIPADTWEGRGRLTVGGWMSFFVMSVGVMYAGGLTGNLISAVFGAILDKPTINAVEQLVLGSNWWLLMLLVVLLAPVVEEYLFRKLLIERLHRYGDRVAIIVSAVLFGLMHGNLYQFFYAFGLGAIFAYVYIKTRKLIYTVFLHMAINFMGSVLAPLMIKLMPQVSETASPADILPGLDSAGLMGYALGTIYTILLICTAVAGIVLLLKKWKRAEFSAGTHSIEAGRRSAVIFANPGMICYVAACLGLFILSLLV